MDVKNQLSRMQMCVIILSAAPVRDLLYKPQQSA